MKEKLYTAPTWNGIGEITDFAFDYLNYFATTTFGDDLQSALVFMVVVIITTFILKNASKYFAEFFMIYLRNGVLKDIR